MATIGDQWNSVGWITVPIADASSNSGTGTYISLSSSSNVVSLKDLPYWPQAPDMDIAKAQKMLMAAAKALQTMRQMAEQLKGLDAELALKALAALETYDNDVDAAPPSYDSRLPHGGYLRS